MLSLWRVCEVWQTYWLTEAQIGALLHTVGVDGDPLSARDHTPADTRFVCGLRIGELHRPAWRDILRSG